MERVMVHREGDSQWGGLWSIGRVTGHGEGDSPWGG